MLFHDLLPRIQTLIGASERLLALMDAVPIDPALGANTDRVFPRYEFDELRAALDGLDPIEIAQLFALVHRPTGGQDG